MAMRNTSECFDSFQYPLSEEQQPCMLRPDILSCSWSALQAQLMQQWPGISEEDLQATGPYRRRIAVLIGEKYGISATLVEHYLRNFEHTIYARLCLLHGDKR